MTVSASASDLAPIIAVAVAVVHQRSRASFVVRVEPCPCRGLEGHDRELVAGAGEQVNVGNVGGVEKNVVVVVIFATGLGALGLSRNSAGDH